MAVVILRKSVQSPWPYRGILLVGILINIIPLIINYFQIVRFVENIPVIVVIIIAWFVPFGGGIALLVTLAVRLILFSFSYGSYLPVIMLGAIPEHILAIAGGVLAVIYGRNQRRSRKDLETITEAGQKKDVWRWVPRGFFLLAILLPLIPDLFDVLVIQGLSLKYTHIGGIALFVGLPAVVFIWIITWVVPFAGGIIALIAVFPLIFWYAFMHWDMPVTYSTLYIFYILSFAAGGISSIIYGVRCRRSRNVQS